MKLKIILQYIFLSIIQGITEPLPISSSGHIVIIKKIFKFNLPLDLNFEIIVNFGSFLAIIFLYRKKIGNLIKNSYNYLLHKTKDNKSFNYIILIIISTIPAGIFGLIFKNKIEFLSNNIILIALALLITGLCLFFIKDSKGKKENINKKDALIIGIYQIFALFPGISRSGSTIFGALNQNIKKEEAVDYSFMLYLPISFSSFILSIKDLSITNLNSNIYIFLICLIISMIITYFSSKWFINIIKKEKLIYFSLYCIIISIIILIIYH